jgi:hypothetical protein
MRPAVANSKSMALSPETGLKINGAGRHVEQDFSRGRSVVSGKKA